MVGAGFVPVDRGVVGQDVPGADGCEAFVDSRNHPGPGGDTDRDVGDRGADGPQGAGEQVRVEAVRAVGCFRVQVDFGGPGGAAVGGCFGEVFGPHGQVVVFARGSRAVEAGLQHAVILP